MMRRTNIDVAKSPDASVSRSLWVAVVTDPGQPVALHPALRERHGHGGREVVAVFTATVSRSCSPSCGVTVSTQGGTGTVVEVVVDDGAVVAVTAAASPTASSTIAATAKISTTNKHLVVAVRCMLTIGLQADRIV